MKPFLPLRLAGTICALTLTILFCLPAFGQHVGIGTATPLMKLHVASADSTVLLLENTQSLGTGVSTTLNFKTGSGPFPFTGAIRTIGQNTTEARLGLFTYAFSSPNGLQERLSILDNGHVGIGTTTPTAKLEVAGNVKVNGNISNVTDPVAAQDAATKHYVDQMAEILLDAGLHGVVMDIDGNAYKTIKLDTQVWMAENLRTTRYNDGTAIPNVTDNAAWQALTTPAYCWYNNDSTLHAKIYGALYNYHTVANTNSHNVCPTGWHVPSDAEWTVLSNFLTANGYGNGGSGPDIGKSMASTFGWSSGGVQGTISFDQGTNNSSGLACRPGGNRFVNGAFLDITFYGYWWTATEVTMHAAWIRLLSWASALLGRDSSSKPVGFSVRCVRD